MSEPLLQVKNLRINFRLENKQVVSATEGVNFSLDKKTTLGIVGESGCGKSVTASSILGLLPKGVGYGPSTGSRSRSPAPAHPR